MGDVVDSELAEFAADPHAGIVGAELDGVEGSERDQAGHELKEGVL